MVRVLGGVAAMAFAAAGVAHAGSDQPIYAPEPAWVKPVPIPFDMKPGAAAGDLLLRNIQERLGPEGEESFSEVAVRINAPEGLQQAGSLSQVWTPLTDTLTIHRARILRGSKIIDLLANGRKFTVLRREPNLEAAMIDGSLTATLQPEDVEVGDVLDFAFTVVRKEPALAGHAEGGAAVGHAGAIGRLVVRASWPAGHAFHVWKTDDLPPLTPVTKDGWTEISLDQTNAVSPEAPKGADVYDRLFGLMEVDDFKDWRDVSATAWPLYDKAATLKPDSPLKAEIARIRAANPDPKARALAALKLVESQTRYLFIGLNVGGYTPAPADETWARRFGDCKGKTVLLLALLRGLDIAAEPALVSTTAGEALNRELPAFGAFDHVMVRAEIAGKTYWLDATRMGDENLDVIPIPNDHWTLPVTKAGGSLEPIGPEPPLLPYTESVLKADMSAGLDKPAKVHAELIMRGDLALFFDLAIKKASATDEDRALKAMFTASHSWLTSDKVAFTYDPQTMTARAVADGSGVLPFASSAGTTSGVRDWSIDGAAIGYSPDFSRPSPYHHEASYAVAYPSFERTSVEVKLPDGGKGFELNNGGVISRTLAGMAYSRSTTIKDGALSMMASSRAVASSFPASEATAATVGLRGLDNYDAFLRYSPPAEPTTTATFGKAPAPTPQPDGELRADGEAAFKAKDYAKAEASFTKALATGTSAPLFYNRGVARAAQGKLDTAESDFKAAQSLDARFNVASYALGQIALRRKDFAEADRQFTRFFSTSEKPQAVTLAIAAAYETVHRYHEAYVWADRGADTHAEPQRQAAQLNESCWTRAEAGEDLKTALSDCDKALQLAPGASHIQDSRALVELRLGQIDKAATDYNEALKGYRSYATSLYGRSVAERRLGRTSEADRDASAAAIADPEVAKRFGGWGVTP